MVDEQKLKPIDRGISGYENYILGELQEWAFTFECEDDEVSEVVDSLVERFKLNKCTREDYENILFHLWQKNG